MNFKLSQLLLQKNEKNLKKVLTNEISYDIFKCAYIKGLFFVVQK